MHPKSLLQRIIFVNRFLYDLSRFGGLLLAGWLWRRRSSGLDDLPAGKCLIFCNHISHFDPPALVLALSERRVHFMTMDCLFQPPWFSAWLKAVGCFPVNPDLPDLRAVRKTVRLLQEGKTVVIFPDGGIRVAPEAITDGRASRRMARGLAGLAHLTGCPIRTAVVIGTDRLYHWKNWLRGPSVIIKGGGEFRADPLLPRREAREKLTRSLEASFQKTFADLLAALPPDYVPRTAQERCHPEKNQVRKGETDAEILRLR